MADEVEEKVSVAIVRNSSSSFFASGVMGALSLEMEHKSVVNTVNTWLNLKE